MSSSKLPSQRKSHDNILTNALSNKYRLADTSANPKAATAAAKAYFVDLNDMTEWAIKKNGVVICEAYQKSLTDLAAFRKAL